MVTPVFIYILQLALVRSVDHDVVSLLQSHATQREPGSEAGGVADNEGLDADELRNEQDDETNDVHECATWCYSKKHKDKDWEGFKCNWYACSTCPECIPPTTTTTTTTPAPTPSPTPSPTPLPTPHPTPSPTPLPTPSPTPLPTPSPTPVPTYPSPGPYVTHTPATWSGWANNWDNGMHHDCGSQVLTGAYSVHDNGKEDRRWKFSCSAFSAPPAGYQKPYLYSCGWTGYTGWDASWTMPGSGNHYVIAGVKSHHDNGKEDRQFSFKTCAVANVHGTGSRTGMSGWYNNWDGELNKPLSDSEFFGDWKSHHDNGREDRQFAFDIATFRYTPK